MVVDQDECPACAAGFLRRQTGVAVAKRWRCDTCLIEFVDNGSADDWREPVSNGAHDVRAIIDFGLRVRAFRVRRRMSEMELAALVGCHWQVIAAIEHGELVPQLRTVLKLGAALQVNPARLVDGLPASLAEHAAVDLR